MWQPVTCLRALLRVWSQVLFWLVLQKVEGLPGNAQPPVLPEPPFLQVFTLSSDSNYTNGPQQLFPPPPSVLPVWLPHSCKLDLLLGLSAPCLGHMRCCISVTFSPAEWGSNVRKTFHSHWVPSSFCNVLPSLTQGHLEDTVWGFLSFIHLLSETLLPTWVYVMPCLGSNTHPQPWLHHSP